MTGNTDQILELLFGTRRLEEVSVSDLKDLMEEFPSFNAAHYLLSKKLKLVDSEEFSSETQKTALYFTNPFWLHWLLETPESSLQESTEMPSAELDITGSESSVWNNHASKPQESISYFEESITPDKNSGFEPVEKMTGEEIHHQESHYSDFEKTVEQDAMVENSNADFLTEQLEISNTQTESINESFPADIDKKDKIVQQTEPETFNENQGSFETGDGLNFHEPDGFREEPVPFVQKDEIVTDSGIAPSHEQPAESAEPSVEEAKITHPESDQSEPLSRPAFFWEKEFHARKEDDVTKASEEDSPPIAQIPTLTPFQDNPAFLLAETELLLPDAGSRTNEDVSPDPSFQKTEIQDDQNNESRIFFEHHSTIWEPTPIKEVESVHEHPVEATHESIADQSSPPSEMAKDQLANEPINTTADELAETPVQKVQTDSIASAIDNPPDELSFTPYHTIDYFASQGIRFIQEENPTDKFGKQLKSFTAWLKTMKRLPKTLLESEMSAVSEAAILDIAEHSIEEKEVITEAMAQVLALQGQTDKAIELYQKLSLLNPLKSAYFAARIEQIKSDLT